MTYQSSFPLSPDIAFEVLPGHTTAMLHHSHHGQYYVPAAAVAPVPPHQVQQVRHE